MELHVNEPDEHRGAVRRKKVCPSCRVQVVSPPLELWALKGVLAALRGTDESENTKGINKDLWEGLFDPATFYHIIRDHDDGVLRCGACSSEILEGQCTNPEWYGVAAYGSAITYEDMTDDEHDWHRSEAVNVESEEEDPEDDEAGSLEDFVVDDDNEEEEVTSQDSYGSSNSGIASVSPPSKPKRSETHAPPPSSAGRRERLNALAALRARKHGSEVRIYDDSSEGEDDSDEERKSMSSDIAALEDSPEASDDD